MKLSTRWLALALTIACTFATPHALAVDSFALPWMNSDLTPNMYRSSDFPKSVFVIETFFLGCPYCNQNAPNVHELAAEYEGNEMVQILDLGIDRSDSQYAEWIRRHNPRHPVLKDASRTVVRQLGTTGYPSVYVIDCHGNVALEDGGVWNSTTKKKIRNKIEDLLSAGCQ